MSPRERPLWLRSVLVDQEEAAITMGVQERQVLSPTKVLLLLGLPVVPVAVGVFPRALMLSGPVVQVHPQGQERSLQGAMEEAEPKMDRSALAAAAGAVPALLATAAMVPPTLVVR